jgi:hypothetical protein
MKIGLQNEFKQVQFWDTEKSNQFLIHYVGRPCEVKEKMGVSSNQFEPSKDVTESVLAKLSQEEE